MASGVPVVVSNGSSLTEIVGNAGILVDPYNVDEIAAGIYTASFENHKRALLIKKGLIRSKLFDWQKCADTTLQILKESIN